MDRRNGFDRLDFNNNLFINDQVSTKSLIQTNTIPGHRNRFLSVNTKSALIQFVCYNSFINRFKESRPKGAMDFEADINNYSGNLILCHWLSF